MSVFSVAVSFIQSNSSSQDWFYTFTQLLMYPSEELQTTDQGYHFLYYEGSRNKYVAMQKNTRVKLL